jgi:hypothetical protein
MQYRISSDINNTVRALEQVTTYQNGIPVRAGIGGSRVLQFEEAISNAL